MQHIRYVLVFGLVLAVCGLPLASARGPLEDETPDDEQYAVDATEADQLADQVLEQIGGPQLPVQPQPSARDADAPKSTHASLAKIKAASLLDPVVAKEGVKVDAMTAHKASEVAKQAAVVANKVANHSVHIVSHAKKALKHALGALHDARVESSSLSEEQRHSLKKAEAHLREATKAADYGKLKKARDARELQKERMQADLDKNAGKTKAGQSEKERMQQEIQDIRKQLKAKKQDDKDIDKALDDLEKDIEKSDGTNNDELKAELERLRETVDQLEEADENVKVEYEVPKATQKKPEDGKAKTDERDGGEAGGTDVEVATPIETKGIDIDTAMPYGDLEPFGREDTAQELTEQSISETDEMVDQLERAEVAEEKRAVFRALTRLRGAAITSFDGVARSQTGNIDEYNKIHQWRTTHPLHHLADEESDVSKWAFPENAD